MVSIARGVRNADLDHRAGDASRSAHASHAYRHAAAESGHRAAIATAGGIAGKHHVVLG
jgi:hypothetical protein